MDAKAQVALEYLLTVAFGILLATVAALLAFQVAAISQVAEKNIEQLRQEAILNFLGG
ncbi:MAG: hypothetical protein Q8P05_05880 [Candidatus Diapherotrites archaeon]|nr:hypothetical protein [Candidatus Diapherotrites archaeon]MDZ4256589.1 hypothetical protein [archaeon]